MSLAGVVSPTPDHSQYLLQSIAPASTARTAARAQHGACLFWAAAATPAHPPAWCLNRPHAPLLFAGRLDNRAELSSALGVSAAAEDGALAAAAWDRWQDDAPRQMIGAFILAAWDNNAEELVLATDSSGFETIYTIDRPEGFAFAGHPRLLLGYPGMRMEADIEHVGHWLWHYRFLTGRSMLRGIGRVAPGEVMRVGRERRARRFYWRPGEAPTLPLRGDDEYVEAARDMLARVVQPHLPEGGAPLSAELTGGLDSGAIVSTALRLRPALAVDCFTTLPEPGAPLPADTADEWLMVQAIGAMHPALRLHGIPAGGLNTEETDQATLFEDLCAPPFSMPGWAWQQNRLQAMSAAPSRQVLSGLGGNQTLSHSGFGRLAELARHGRWLALNAELHALSRIGGEPAKRLLLWHVLLPLLPPALRRQVFRWRGGSPSRWRDINAIHPAIIERFGWDRRVQGLGLPSPPHAAFMQRDGRVDEMERLLGGIFVSTARYRREGLDLRAPFLDRRMIDFCHSLPAAQYLRDGQTRFLARRVLAGRLPQQTLAKPDVFHNTPEWHHRMTRSRPHWMAALERLETSASVGELLDVPRLRKLAEAWPDEASRQPMEQYRMILPRTISAGQFIRWANREN